MKPQIVRLIDKRNRNDIDLTENLADINVLKAFAIKMQEKRQEWVRKKRWKTHNHFVVVLIVCALFARANIR